MMYLKLRSGLKKFKHISEGLNLYNKKNDSTVSTDSEIWRDEQFEEMNNKTMVLVGLTLLVNEPKTSKWKCPTSS